MSLLHLLSNIKLVFRGLLRAPGFAIAAVLTLSLGIGANTAMFSVAEAALWRPMPAANPDRLVHLWETNPLKHWSDAPAAPANFADWQQRNHVFSVMGAYLTGGDKAGGGFDVVMTGGAQPQRLKALMCTGNLFRILEVNPLLGRTFRDEETFASAKRVAILSWQLWQARFGGAEKILGQTIMLNSLPYEVIGVMPREFYFPSRGVQVWIPLGFKPAVFAEQRRPHYLDVVARLKPGVGIAEARAEMNHIASQLEREHPDNNTRMGVGLGPLQDWFTGEARPGILLLLGAVGFLLLIVCANVANLQLSRAVARSRELAIRRALGASRLQIVEQLALESLILALLGGGIGVLLVVAAKRLVASVMPSLPGAPPFQVDVTVLLFAAGISILTAIVFGVAPAYISSGTGPLTERGGTGSRPNRRMRGVLVASEVALSVILVSGAGLFARSLQRLQEVNPGFQAGHSLTFSIELPDARYRQTSQVLQAFREIERRLRDLPQVQAVGLARTAALQGTAYTVDATVEGRGGDDYERELHRNAITTGYFTALGTPLLRGRWFMEDDEREGAPLVTLVNETLEKKYFRGQSALGKRLKFGRPKEKDPWVTVVGVVADTKQANLSAAVQPEVYAPFSKDPSSQATFVLRTSGTPESLTPAARAAVHQMDRDLVLIDVKTLAGVIEDSTQGERFRSTVLIGFAGAALLLAGLGIYGVLAYLVTLRTREIGVRIALGARTGQLMTLIVQQGMMPVLIGLSVGLASALEIARLTRTLLFGIESTDPGTYVVTIVILAVVAASACAIPALRATRVDPVIALRNE